MQKSIIALGNGVGIYEKGKLCVAVVDSYGDKRVGGRGINPVPKFFVLPFLRGIYYFFKNIILTIIALDLAETLDGMVKDENKTALQARKFNMSSLMIATICALLGSFLAGILLIGALPHFVAEKLIEQEGQFMKNLFVATFRVALVYLIFCLLRFLPQLKSLYSFNRAGCETLTGKGGLKNASSLNFLNFLVNTFLFCLFVISLIGIRINPLVNCVLNLAILFAGMALTYEVLRFFNKSKSLVLKEIGLITNWLVNATPNLTQKEVLRVAEIEIKNSNFESEKKGTYSISSIYAEMENKLKAKDKFEESDAQWIVATCLGKSRSEAKLVRHVSEKEYREIMRACERRSKGEPLSSIFGFVDFFGLRFEVNKKVLSPRMETEILVEEVIKKIRENDLSSVLDLCTGSGAIGVTIAKLTDATVTGADISKQALQIAQLNATKNGVRMEFLQSDLFNELKKRKKYDIIVSNPPYIKSDDIPKLDEEVKKYDPRIALDGGDDGLEFYRKIVDGGPLHLNKKGWLFLEIGKGQHEDVWNLMNERGFSDIQIIKDYNKIERIIYGRYSK